MSNLELTKHYLNLQTKANTNPMPTVRPTDIVPTLNKHFGGQWTWELADEKLMFDDTVLCTTVTVYVPGRVLTGRSVIKGYNEFSVNHLNAIANACQILMDTEVQSSSQTTTPVEAQPTMQMTPDQIMNALGQTPAVIMPQQPEALNQPVPTMADEVPFDTAVDTIQQGMAQMQQPTPQPMQQPIGDYDAPQARLKGFSQRQIDRLNKFKVDFDIMNDDMFGNFVNTWDKTLTSKNDIVPSNANAFLDWAENLGKMAC